MTPNLPARTAIAAIRLYQLVWAGRPSPCRYWPTCSEYAREAFGLHGFARGTGLTARRLLRCRPGAGKGWDPVPAPGEHARREGHLAAERGTERLVSASPNLDGAN